MSKEDKFFESLRDFAGFTGRVGFLLEETAEGRMAVSESYKECSDIKMKCRESYGLLMERMYKAYKDPSQLDMAMVGETPEELTLMARLSAASLSELKKIMDYTTDVSENFMKMEARCRRIYTFEERGDDCFRRMMKKLYGSETKAAELVYWKEIFDHLEEVLDASAGTVPLLQKIITRY